MSGATCNVVNQWYYQCIPGSSVPGPTPTDATTTPGQPAPTQIPTGVLQQLSNFGPNPANLRVFIYVPQGLGSNPAVVVVLHPCGGSASQMHSGYPWKGYADSGKYVLLYPEAINSEKCYDVRTSGTLTHDGGGDSLGIASAVRWTISNFTADKKRVFATGFSSGAMMTNVLMGAYPDLFVAGSAFAGTSFGCFAGAPSTFYPPCDQGQIQKTAQEWGNIVRAAYPGYTGPRPKMQTWHGTADTVVNVQNLKEQVKQWTNVHNVSETPSATVQNYAQSGWTRTDYGANVMAISAPGVGHGIPYQGAQVKAWFGLA